MIPPRRASSAADPDLILGLLGLAVILEQVRTAVDDLASDGDLHRHEGDLPDDEVVAVVLGIAALATGTARQRLDACNAAPDAQGQDPRASGDLVMTELLR